MLGQVDPSRMGGSRGCVMKVAALWRFFLWRFRTRHAAPVSGWYRTSVSTYQTFRMCKSFENRRFWYVSGNSWYMSLLSPQYVRLRFSAVHDPSISRCVGKIYCTASDLWTGGKEKFIPRVQRVHTHITSHEPSISTYFKCTSCKKRASAGV